jgi:hypothetical protein
MFAIMTISLAGFIYDYLSYLSGGPAFQNYNMIQAFKGNITTESNQSNGIRNLTTGSGEIANHSPVAEDMTILTDPDGNSPVRFSLKAEDPDPSDTDKLNYTLVTKPKSGDIRFFDSSTGDIIYDPAHLAIFGEDSITFRVTDSNGLASNPGLVIFKPSTNSTNSTK